MKTITIKFFFACCSLLLLVGCNNSSNKEIEDDDNCINEDLRKFVDGILSNPATFEMDFKNEQDSLEVVIVESPDGKVRFYSWPVLCGNSLYFTNIYQTKIDGKVCAVDWRNDFENNCSYSQINAIRQVESSGGTIYLLLNYCGDHMIRDYRVDAYKINKRGRLIPIDVFDNTEYKYDEMQIKEYCSRTGVSFNCALELPSMFEKDGWNDSYFFDLTGEDIYIPALDKASSYYAEYQTNDFYHHYHWNGEKFRYDHVRYNPALEKYINLSPHLEYEFELGKLFVRIDKSNDETYRYIAWKKDNMFTSVPELVIESGWCHEVKHEYYFENRNYEYVFKLHEKEDYLMTDYYAFLHIYQTDMATGKKKEIASYKIEDLFKQP